MIICSMPQCQTAAGCVCGMATAPVGSVIPTSVGERPHVPMRLAKPIRFGPDQDLGRVIRGSGEFDRIVRETIERMRKPLWFWEEWGLPDRRAR